jgi:hypothetical protein
VSAHPIKPAVGRSLNRGQAGHALVNLERALAGFKPGDLAFNFENLADALPSYEVIEQTTGS